MFVDTDGANHNYKEVSLYYAVLSVVTLHPNFSDGSVLDLVRDKCSWDYLELAPEQTLRRQWRGEQQKS